MSTAATGGHAQGPGQREVVFCHKCWEEWYRDDHGLVCPRCREDFVEILENRHSISDPSQPRIVGGFPHFGVEGEGDTDDDMDSGPDIEEESSFVEGPYFRYTRRTRISNQISGAGERQPSDLRLSGIPVQENRGVDSASEVTMLEMVQQIFANIMGDGSSGISTGSDTTRNSQQGSNNDPLRPPEPAPQGQGSSEGAASSGSLPGFPHFAGSGRFIYQSNVNADGTRTVRAGPQVEDIASVLQSVFAHTDPSGGLLGSIMGIAGASRGSDGDYALSETHLDRIISELMEQHQGNAPPPARPEVLAGLPKIKIDQKRVDEGEDCAVCKEEWVLHEEVVQLPCKHVYHEFCVKKWLEVHDTCPICRKSTSEHGQNHRSPSSQPHSNHFNVNTNRPPGNIRLQNSPPRTTRAYGWSLNILGGHSHNHNHNSTNNGNGGNASRSGISFAYGMPGSWNSGGNGGNNSFPGQNNNGQQRPQGDRNNNRGSH